MIAELLKQKEDEIKHKDFCTGEFNSNQLDTEKRTREKADLEAKIEDLDLLIKKLTEEIATLKAEVAEMQTQLKFAPAGPPPPPGFEAYEKNKAADGVMGLIQQII